MAQKEQEPQPEQTLRPVVAWTFSDARALFDSRLSDDTVMLILKERHPGDMNTLTTLSILFNSCVDRLVTATVNSTSDAFFSTSALDSVKISSLFEELQNPAALKLFIQNTTTLTRIAEISGAPVSFFNMLGQAGELFVDSSGNLYEDKLTTFCQDMCHINQDKSDPLPVFWLFRSPIFCNLFQSDYQKFVSIVSSLVDTDSTLCTALRFNDSLADLFINDPAIRSKLLFIQTSTPSSAKYIFNMLKDDAVENFFLSDFSKFFATADSIFSHVTSDTPPYLPFLFDEPPFSTLFVSNPGAMCDIAIIAQEHTFEVMGMLENDQIRAMFLSDTARFLQYISDISHVAGTHAGIVFETLASESIAPLFAAFPGKVANLVRLFSDPNLALRSNPSLPQTMSTSSVQPDILDSFILLSNEHIRDFCLSNENSFIYYISRIATAAGESASLVFYSLAEEPTASLFAANPEKFASIARTTGHDCFYVFESLKLTQTRTFFETDFDNFLKLASAAGLANMIVFSNTDSFQDLLIQLKRIKSLHPELTSEQQVNVAHGYCVLGEASAEKLMKERNIWYFLRYTNEELERQMYQLDHSYIPKYASLSELQAQDSKPIMLIIYNHADWNGAFYQNDDKFNQLSANFKVVLWEAGTEDEFYSAVILTGKAAAKESKRISKWDIGAHGSESGMLLGEDNEKGRLDISDIDELIKLRPYLCGSEGVLESCSTAAGLTPPGSIMQVTTGSRKVSAPEESTAVSSWGILTNGDFDIEYFEGVTKIFE